MGFDVGNLRSHRSGRRLESADLVDGFRSQIIGVVIHVSPTETCEVAVTHVRADAHAPFLSEIARADHHQRVACVEPACDVGAGHQVEDGTVVADSPCAEAFAEIAVEVNGWGG